MKTMKKFIAIFCAAVMLFTSFGVLSVIAAASTSYDTPVKPEHWENAVFSEDHAYSFAFVGDTQFLTLGDALSYGTSGQTNKLQTLYQYIADTAADRKLAHVFVLGDMTDRGYKNDGNLAGSYYSTPWLNEWILVDQAISRLNGIVPYTLVRGNHDDYMMDDYFNVPTYTEQFTTTDYSYSNSAYTGTTTNGGFYSDSTAKWSETGEVPGKSWLGTNIAYPGVSREADNPDGYVYWSAKKQQETGDGHYENSIVNSWKTVEISGTKYLFMTIDFNPTDNVLKWVDDTLKNFPDHKAIVTTHGYLNSSGQLITSEQGSTNYLFDNPASVLWEEVLSQHENVFMVVSGHVGSNNVRYGYNTGVNGNRVLQVLVDPQNYDTREDTYNEETGEYTYWEEYRNTQDTGMVLYMNFSADGQTITFDYYSTLLGKMKKYNDYVIHVGEDATVTSGDVDLSSLEAYGQKNAYVTKPSLVAPTLDGVVNTNEYTTIKTMTASEAGYSYESDLTEYFAYDDEYIYYAFSIKQTYVFHYSTFTAATAAAYNSGWGLSEGDANYVKAGDKLCYTKAEADAYNDSLDVWEYSKRIKVGTQKSAVSTTYQFNFKPNYAWADYDDLYANHYARGQIKFQIDDSGNVTPVSNTILSPATQTVVNLAMPYWNEDVFIAGSRTSDCVNTFEIKISKEYFAEQMYPDIDNIAYFLYLGFDSSKNTVTGTGTEAEQFWYRWDGTSAAIKALKADGYTGSSFSHFQYMKFVEESPISTRSTASVRLSSTSSGLRFKSEVDTETLQYYLANYSDVQIGTLIAPTDMLNGQKLTHDIGKDGEAYIDVKATVNKPFEEKKNGITVYAGSIVNINEKNLDRDFSAVGYIKYIDEEGNQKCYYSDVTATRNVSDVAEAAYFDIKATEQTGYLNLVTVDGDPVKGFYSPYTKGQRSILKALIVEKYNDKNDPFASDIF